MSDSNISFGFEAPSHQVQNMCLEIQDLRHQITGLRSMLRYRDINCARLNEEVTKLQNALFRANEVISEQSREIEALKQQVARPVSPPLSEESAPSLEAPVADEDPNIIVSEIMGEVIDNAMEQVHKKEFVSEIVNEVFEKTIEQVYEKNLVVFAAKRTQQIQEILEISDEFRAIGNEIQELKTQLAHITKTAKKQERRMKKRAEKKNKAQAEVKTVEEEAPKVTESPSETVQTIVKNTMTFYDQSVYPNQSTPYVHAPVMMDEKPVETKEQVDDERYQANLARLHIARQQKRNDDMQRVCKSIMDVFKNCERDPHYDQDQDVKPPFNRNTHKLVNWYARDRFGYDVFHVIRDGSQFRLKFHPNSEVISEPTDLGTILSYLDEISNVCNVGNVCPDTYEIRQDPKYLDNIVEMREFFFEAFESLDDLPDFRTLCLKPELDDGVQVENGFEIPYLTLVAYDGEQVCLSLVDLIVWYAFGKIEAWAKLTRQARARRTRGRE
jgi:hypothetical protein